MSVAAPYIDMHTHREGRVVILCGARELLCRGIHPWKAGEAAQEEYSIDGIAAIGEIGLDYAVDVDRGLQKALFERQLALAEAHDLPVVVHCVRAMDDTLALLAGRRLRAVVFHGFSGNPQVARRAIDRGYYLSFGERTFRSPKTLETLRTISSDRLFLETDISQTQIESIYSRAAEAMGVDLGDLRAQIYDNYEKIFG